LGLERRDIDLLHGTVRVERTVNHVPGGALVGPPKTAAGSRTVSIPPHVLPALREHLSAHVGADPSSPVLAGTQGGRVRPSVLQQAWEQARRSIGRQEAHFHDLRHAGATWLAVSGATTKELMARCGHASPDASLRYQHATEERDTALAAALSGLVEAAPVATFSPRPRDIRGMESEAVSNQTGVAGP
ncbi:MAG: tyrosine-type recombinase/integrase, partial [Acidimicrobiales bacterium]